MEQTLSYSEQDGNVVLTMSREDYEGLLRVFARATVWAKTNHDKLEETVALLDRLNQGNPNYTPYQVKP